MLYHWRIKQGGLVVASGFAGDRLDADHEAIRYHVQYSQDGPVVYEVRETNTRWRKPR
jgi:hypothetical protein